MRRVDGVNIVNVGWRNKPWHIIENEETFDDAMKRDFVPIDSFASVDEMYEKSIINNTMTKDIIRFFRKGGKRDKQIIFYSVTKEQAQEWCSSPLTKKEGVYFDGFDDHGAYGLLRT